MPRFIFFFLNIKSFKHLPKDKLTRRTICSSRLLRSFQNGTRRNACLWSPKVAFYSHSATYLESLNLFFSYFSKKNWTASMVPPSVREFEFQKPEPQLHVLVFVPDTVLKTRHRKSKIYPLCSRPPNPVGTYNILSPFQSPTSITPFSLFSNPKKASYAFEVSSWPPARFPKVNRIASCPESSRNEKEKHMAKYPHANIYTSFPSLQNPRGSEPMLRLPVPK